MSDDNDTPWTMDVPAAAKKYYGIKSKDAAYAAAHAGIIPTVRVGRFLRALPRVIERQLETDQSPAGEAAQ